METFPIAAPSFNGSSRTVAADNAIAWFKQGWALFVANPGVWIGMTVILLVILVAMEIVPVIGALAANLLTPVFSAGMLLGCQKVSKGETLEIADLFAGFKQNTGNLVIVGVLSLAGVAVILLSAFVLAGGSAAAGMMLHGSTRGGGVAAVGGIILSVLVALALMVPLMMALWFAPALVFFNNMAPVAALKASFNACLKNTVPLLVYGLIALVLLFLAALPLFLGLLVLIPVLWGSLYASYRDIFVAD